MHTFTRRRRSQPRTATAGSSGAVRARRLARGDPPRAGDQTSRHAERRDDCRRLGDHTAESFLSLESVRIRPDYTLNPQRRHTCVAHGTITQTHQHNACTLTHTRAPAGLLFVPVVCVCVCVCQVCACVCVRGCVCVCVCVPLNHLESCLTVRRAGWSPRLR